MNLNNFKQLLSTLFIISSTLLSTSSDITSDETLTNLGTVQKKQCLWKELDSIHCSYGRISEVPFLVKNLFQKTPFKNLTSIKLSLLNCEYFPNIITSNWFDMEHILPLKIIELNIDDKNSIFDIEPNAFNSTVFASLEILRIRKTAISHLRHGIFQGLSKVLYLVLIQMPIKKMDENFLQHLPSLKAVEIEEINTVPFNLRNATGLGKMRKLETVSFRHNNLCRTINHKTFRGLPAIMRLILSYSKIQTIGAGTFDPISDTIYVIYLNGNLLKSLPNHLFDKLMQVQQPWKVYSSDNLWECDCNLSGLKKYTEKNLNNNFVNPIVCFSPQMYHGKFLSQISMCNCDDDSLDTKMTEKYTDVIANCPKSGYQEFIKLNESKNQINHEISQYLISNGQRIEIFHISNEDGISISIHFTSNSYALIWFNYERCSSSYFNEDDDHCTSIYEKTIKISNITANSTYTFCILNKGSQILAPDNCLPYYVTNWNENSIPIRQAKDFAYIMVTVFLVLMIFALFFGIFFGICLARRYPSFVKSTSSSKILIQQIRHNEIWASPNIDRNSQPSQMSPTAKAKTHTKRFRPLAFRRRSDSSLASSRSYITAITPSPLDILNWKMDFGETSDSLNSDLYEIDHYSSKTMSTVHSCNQPPPIPPHPNRKLNQQPAKVVVKE